jgi:murein DD-endopeptidase MepM/ murein hydrolase activator NlpD
MGGSMSFGKAVFPAGLFLICVVVVLITVGRLTPEPGHHIDEALAEPLEFQGPPIPPEFRVARTEDRFPRNSNVRDVLVGVGFSNQEIHRLIEQTRSVHNLNRVTAGHRFAVERFDDGRFRRLEYDIDDTKYLIVTMVEDRYEARIEERVFDVVLSEVAGRITDSLWNTLVSAGESGTLVMSITELLQWDIDFTTIQPDDSFKLIFEKLYYRDEFVKYGNIHALEFNHGGRSFHAFLFDNPETGKKSYFDFEGKGVRKAFLKVPFRYDYRISSGFSYSRLHPVTGQRRPHMGIDYAAPHGTPVLASGSGRVVFAGWRGANGQTVQIRHPNGFTTHYLHLSRIFVKVGQSVAQGQRIGNVGATGLATGPHLDYRIQDRQGRFLNPQRMVALPSETEISADRMEEFKAVRDRYLKDLEEVLLEPSYLDGIAVAG